MSKKTIILVDPCSSRLKFIDEIIKAGCDPLCIFPYRVYSDSFESMQFKNEVSNNMAICRQNSTVIEAPENIDSIIPQLKELEVIAVINCSDSATHLSDVLAEKLGCPGNPSSNSDIRMDKFDMQKAITDFGLRHIRTAVVKSEEDIRKFWTENNLTKAVIKPARSGGMKGVHQCGTITEAVAILYSLMNDTDVTGQKNEKIVIQEYLEGSHYFLNTVSINGTHKIMQSWIVKHGYMPNGTYEITYVTIPLYPSGYRETVKYIFNVLDALDFKNGVAQTEVVVDSSGPVLVEINPRMMKFYVDPDIQDKVFGNHNSDIAIQAILEPGKFLSEWDAGHCIKPLMIKHLISTVEGQRYARPAEVLLQHTNGVVKVEMNVPTDGMTEITKTSHRDLNPGKVQIFADEVSKHINALYNIRIIEKRYPDLLWDKVIQHEGCGYTSDISEIASELKGKTVAILNDASTLEWKDGKYGTADYSKKYGYGVIILGGPYKLDERYTMIKKFCGIIKEGGVLYALQSSYQNMPYGESGMETILNLFGCYIDIPASGRDTKIRCTVHH